MNENPFAISTFRTNNRQLAYALATAGCSFAPQSEKGPALNIYTVECLRERKVGLGLTLEKAVQVAVDRRIPGNVTYIFTRDANLEECIRVWDETVKEFLRAAHENRPPSFSPIPSSVVMELLCVHANNKERFKELPWFNTPLIMDVASSSREVDGQNGNKKMVTEGKAKIWSLGASQKLKSALQKK